MRSATLHRRAATAALATSAVVLGIASSAAAAGDVLNPGTDLYVDMGSTRVEAAAGLTGQARTDALQLAQYPAATWLERGTPAEVEAQAAAVVGQAEALGEVPVLVAYNIPFRDCAQYSAGGATSVAEYEAWIDGVAAGIGDAPAAVILEPDGLGIIPWYTPLGQSGPEWCQPAEADPATAAADRFAMLSYAVETLGALADTVVYLDGTHSGWLNVGDISDRLAKAGVADADGFFLNVSNYQWTENLVQYGTWISKCLATGDVASCPNQYWNGGPDGTAIADLLGAWTGVALSGAGIWSDTATDPALNTSGINARYAGIEGTTHFVVDTSRNGQGPWTPPAGAYPDAQDWCNPPDRGLGQRPTTDTGNDLVDAFLWVKIPGESDGQCSRGLGPTGTVDPEWGVVDPAAGHWFAQQARQLIELAEPPVPAPVCEVGYAAHGRSPHGFTAQVRLTNTGTTALEGWDLRFAFAGDQTLEHATNVDLAQVGSVVVGDGRRTIEPGKHVVLTLVGSSATGPGAEPLLFLVDGAACTVP